MATNQAFAIWVTGLPASGKSTLVSAVQAQLESLGLTVAVLESDVLRKVFSPDAKYLAEDRDLFYRQLAYVGVLLTQHGVPVIFDATANLRRFREEARKQIPRFLEVYVNTSLETCLARDPKGIYRKAREGTAGAVPGLGAIYESPLAPDVTVNCDQELVDEAARQVIDTLRQKRFIP